MQNIGAQVRTKSTAIFSASTKCVGHSVHYARPTRTIYESTQGGAEVRETHFDLPWAMVSNPYGISEDMRGELFVAVGCPVLSA